MMENNNQNGVKETQQLQQMKEREENAFLQGYAQGNDEFKREAFNKVLDVGERVAELYAETRRVEAQADMVREWSKVEIAKTVSKFKLCQEFMLRTFGERDQVLRKDYELLDKGMQSDDKELILMALQNISSVVNKSPLEDLEQLAKLYDDPTQPVVLDF